MGTEKHTWALAIGRLILATNEIDQMLHIIRRAYFGQTTGSDWVRAVFAVRLALIEKSIEKREPNEFFDMLRPLIARAKAIVAIRNHVAHGTFVLDTNKIAENGLPLDEPSLMRHSVKEKAMHVVTFKEIEVATTEAMSLSDDLSKLLSISHDFRIKPALAVRTRRT